MGHSKNSPKGKVHSNTGTPKSDLRSWKTVLPKQIIEEIKKEIKICIEKNENETQQPKTCGTL